MTHRSRGDAPSFFAGFSELAAVSVLEQVPMSARILVVDDDDAIRRLVGTVLRRQQYETEDAANGLEAMEKLSARPFDAVFLDLMMPIRDGYDVVTYLQGREDRPYVVVMTAAGTKGTRNLDPQVVRRILYKPFDIRDVIAAAAECIGTGTDAAHGGP
jgi:CheY-like chemotaxis protein